MKTTTPWIVLILAVLSIGCQRVSPPAVAPLFDAEGFVAAEKAILAAVAAHEIPGAVLVAGRSGGVVYRKALGNRAVEPAAEAMTEDTIFDLASLTKSLAAASSIMKLVEQGKIELAAPAARYIPEFGRAGKDKITVEQLLLHRAGLIPDNPLSDFNEGGEAGWRKICAAPAAHPPGERFIYSDVGYIALGKIVHAVSGAGVDVFADRELFKPLKMNRTMYRPAGSIREFCAPTEYEKGVMLRGQVHDPRARAMGGVAGHAGLFGTADDLARFCRMLLRGGELDGVRVLKESTVKLMTEAHYLPDSTGGRTYGFDVDTSYSTARGHRFAPGSTFGHTGFTGTLYWMDPVNDAFVILLTNRVHPNGKGSVTGLRRQVMTHAAESLLGPGGVLPGLDALARRNFAPLAGRKIGLITNQTGVDRFGRRNIDLLKAAPGVQLLTLFSPEHGIEGKLDEKIGHSIDKSSGLKVWSLYGESRKPTAPMLVGLDTLVYDIQDIGTRFYTYPATMANCMRAAAEHKLTFIVLDRPNPISPLGAQGPVADADKFAFTAVGPLPLTHGLTLGELAVYLNAELKINCDLQIVKIEGWNHAMWWNQTGLMWVNPSPNMRSPVEAALYPAIGLMEFADISVGRGTDIPFEHLGAPYIDGVKLAAELTALKLPGLRFDPETFTPDSSKFAKQKCGGVRIRITDRAALKPASSGLLIAATIRRLYGDQFQGEKVLKLLANAQANAAWPAAMSAADLESSWRVPAAAFSDQARDDRLYP